MKELISSIWEQVLGRKAPFFQNEEDALEQLANQLRGLSSRRRLLVLDDVWRKADLDKLSSCMSCFQLLLTTRHSSILQSSHRETIYKLGLLRNEDARRLFCYHAFGQDSIPTWVDEPQLVEEVIKRCGNLPLALKVIGSSLYCDELFRPLWSRMFKRLRDARSFGEHHKDELVGTFKPSFDALDSQLQECFLDLAILPRSSHWPAKVLLDMWVHIQNMDWDDAIWALVELSDRGLLDLYVINQGARVHMMAQKVHIERALRSKLASAKLLVSQHDIIKDLALYLLRQDFSLSSYKRMLMPNGRDTGDMNWTPETADIVYIDAGMMERDDWPSTLEFPMAKALMLHTNSKNSVYELPKFVETMKELKVLYLRGRIGGVVKIEGEVKIEGNFSQLRSLRVDFMTAIFSEQVTLKSMSNLEDLVVQLSDIPSEGDIGSLSKLKVLQLSWRSLEYVPIREYRKMKYLEEVSLNGGKIEDLPEDFCNLEKLRLLDLDFSMVTLFPKTFRKIESLEKVDIAHPEQNQFTLPTGFGQLVALKKMSLRGSKQLTHLPFTFGKLGSLEVLDLKNCEFLQDLCNDFGGLTSLKHLHLGGCRVLRKLPSSFGELHALEELFLWHSLSLNELPYNFGQLRSLRILSLRFCRNLCQLPESFGDLKALEELSLASCASLQKLPDSFGFLQSLKSLSLADCIGLEQLPKNFGLLNNLEELDLRWMDRLRKLPISTKHGGLKALKMVKCDEKLIPLWKDQRNNFHLIQFDVLKSNYT
ncbi:hypothetical protein KP509_39G035100 [Ceratopteris richardii]|nr:hypothetical protein KP509_39G035100 [Ceratopteris richardii]